MLVINLVINFLTIFRRELEENQCFAVTYHEEHHCLSDSAGQLSSTDSSALKTDYCWMHLTHSTSFILLCCCCPLVLAENRSLTKPKLHLIHNSKAVTRTISSAPRLLNLILTSALSVQYMVG